VSEAGDGAPAEVAGPEFSIAADVVLPGILGDAVTMLADAEGVPRDGGDPEGGPDAEEAGEAEEEEPEGADGESPVIAEEEDGKENAEPIENDTDEMAADAVLPGILGNAVARLAGGLVSGAGDDTDGEPRDARRRRSPKRWMVRVRGSRGSRTELCKEARAQIWNMSRQEMIHDTRMLLRIVFV
jgi:hypothetical protein